MGLFTTAAFQCGFSSFFGLVAFVLSSCGLWLYLGLQSGSCDTSWDCSGVQFTQYKLSSLSSLWSCSGLLKGLAVLCPVFYRLNPAVGENEPLWFTITCRFWATYMENLERRRWLGLESRKPLRRRKFINSLGVRLQTTFRMLTCTHFLVTMTNQRQRKVGEESSFLDIQIFWPKKKVESGMALMSTTYIHKLFHL